jgi:hypothetical protein
MRADFLLRGTHMVPHGCTFKPRRFFLLPLIWSLGIAGTTARADEVATIALQSRLEALQNLAATFDVRTDYDMDPHTLDRLPPFYRRQALELPLHRSETGTAAFSFFKGDARLEYWSSEQTTQDYINAGVPCFTRLIETMSPSRSERWAEQQTPQLRQVSNGTISARGDFPEDWTLDVALGLRLLHSSEWMSNEALSAAKPIESGNPQLYVVQLPGVNGRVHRLTFDPRLRYALVSVRTTFIDGSFQEINNSNFKQYGQLYLPLQVVRTTQYIDSQGKMRHPFVRTLTIQKYVVGDPNNCESMCFITWPKNTEVLDARINEPIQVGDSDRVLTDDAIRAQLTERAQKEQQLEQQAKDRLGNLETSAPSTEPSATPSQSLPQ